jgi:hypothetical protein
MLVIGAADVFIMPPNAAVFCRSLRLLALFHHFEPLHRSQYRR